MKDQIFFRNFILQCDSSAVAFGEISRKADTVALDLPLIGKKSSAVGTGTVRFEEPTLPCSLQISAQYIFISPPGCQHDGATLIAGGILHPAGLSENKFFRSGISAGQIPRSTIAVSMILCKRTLCCFQKIDFRRQLVG